MLRRHRCIFREIRWNGRDAWSRSAGLNLATTLEVVAGPAPVALTEHAGHALAMMTVVMARCACSTIVCWRQRCAAANEAIVQGVPSA